MYKTNKEIHVEIKKKKKNCRETTPVSIHTPTARPFTTPDIKFFGRL